MFFYLTLKFSRSFPEPPVLFREVLDEAHVLLLSLVLDAKVVAPQVAIEIQLGVLDCFSPSFVNLVQFGLIQAFFGRVRDFQSGVYMLAPRVRRPMLGRILFVTFFDERFNLKV